MPDDTPPEEPVRPEDGGKESELDPSAPDDGREEAEDVDSDEEEKFERMPAGEDARRKAYLITFSYPKPEPPPGEPDAPPAPSPSEGPKAAEEPGPHAEGPKAEEPGAPDDGRAEEEERGTLEDRPKPPRKFRTPATMSREEFATEVANAYKKERIPLARYVIVKEFHKRRDPETGDRLPHFHMAVNSSVGHRWLRIRNRLEKEGVKVSFESFNSYSEAARYLLEESKAKKVQELDRRPVFSLEHGPTRGVRCVTDVVRPAAEEEGDAPDPKSVRLRPGDLYDIVIDNDIRDLTSLRMFAHTDRRLVSFCMQHRSNLDSYLEEAWDLRDARRKFDRSQKSRLRILEEAAQSPCLCGGKYGVAVRELLVLQKCREEFPRAMYAAVRDGRRKGRNVFVVGVGDCGKSFVMQPLAEVFDTFESPEAGSFPLVGLEQKEAVLIEDFRWEQGKELLPFDTMLRWLEGIRFMLKRPKGQFAKDLLYTKDSPMFFTGPRRLVRYIGGRVDDVDTGMFDLRFVYFVFKSKIEKPDRKIVKCPACWAALILEGAMP